LRKLKTTLKIPVLALVDSDPYGLKILSVYMKGSMNMSYDSSNLTTPDIKWLGVRPSDLDRFNIPEQCRLPMTDEDLKTGRKLVGSSPQRVSRPRGLCGAFLLRFRARGARSGARDHGLTHNPLPISPNTHKPTKNQQIQLEEDWVRSNPEWVAELQLMLRTRTKAEIQALSSFGFQYLSQVYLPLKLQEGDWI
jgi:meiotic recombination protein SPO11